MNSFIDRELFLRSGLIEFLKFNFTVALKRDVAWNIIKLSRYKKSSRQLAGYRERAD
jgi:hypothetical protein